MKSHTGRSTRFVSMALAISMAGAAIGTASAEPRGPGRNQQHNRHGHDFVLHRGHGGYPAPSQIRHYDHVIVGRPYGHHYPGYGHYRSDASAYRWLAFTAITVALLNSMNEAQQRAYEQAQIQASGAPIGEKIIWKDGAASGSVTAIRDGKSTSGRYCREFQQVVTIGSRTEQAYGTACQQPDGSWEVVSTGSEP